jgi:phage terminase small subunit
VRAAEEALRHAYAARDAAVRAAAAANPDLPGAALARELGLSPSAVRAVLR